MTDSRINLFCLVDGETLSNAFPVEIESSKTIGNLKKLIEDENPNTFSGVDAKDLTLWRVSIPINDEDKNDLPVLLVAAARIQTISEAFPNGLPYQRPRDLLGTSGSKWTYQPDPKLYDKLRHEVKEHYRYFVKGERDKTTMPLYLFLCGAGTGKSRNAQEFYQSTISCLNKDGDQELRSRIEQAWVFHVSLENGTSPLSTEVVPMDAIGSRMLWQLLPGQRIREVVRNYRDVDPFDVLKLVAKGTGRDLQSATVILVIDGLQSFRPDAKDGLNKDSAFYRVLTNIGDLALEDVFLMACCTATVTSSVDQALASTHRHRVVLPVASLKPPFISQNGGSSRAVFDEDDHIIKVLVSDCGGHGRALEGLQEVLVEQSGDFDVELLMNQLHAMLYNLYSEAVSVHSPTAQSIARAIMTQAFLVPNTPVPGTSSFPGEIAIPGLIRYEQPRGLGAGGYLVAPYIWVWLFSYQPEEGADPVLNNWRFCDYSALRSKMDPRSPPGAQFWQHFEHFVAIFRCLKSRMLEDGERTTISAIHAGARLNGDISFKNHRLLLEISSHQADTKSTSYRHHSTLHCEDEEVDIRKGQHCVINAPSVPYGDSFVGLDTHPLRTEVHQCKLITDGGRIDYKAERGKAASDRDFFMLFTSQDCPGVELPSLSGIVDRSNWAHFFGPYAGRAFIFATAGALDINLAPRKHLKGIKGVNNRKADLIIQERTKRKFDSYEDATQRLRGVGKVVLKRFKFPRSA